MSDQRYAPYGVDDDPFLTHPAGPGQAQPPRLAQDQRAPDYWAGDAAPKHGAYDDRYDQPSCGQSQYYDDAVYGAPQPQPQPQAQPQVMRGPQRQPYSAVQPQMPRGHDYADHAPLRREPVGHTAQSNFRPREAAAPAHHPHPHPHTQHGHTQNGQASYDQQDYPAYHFAEDRAAAPRSSQTASASQHADYRPDYRAEYRTVARAEPRLSASVHSAAPSSPQSAQPSIPPRAQMHGFAAPQNAQRHAFSAAQPQISPTYHNQAQPRSYAPLPTDPALPPAYASGAFGFEPSFRVDTAQIVQWAGALCTVAALIGAVLWGYELAVRDAHGIPVVRAAVGPLRVAPETPGGEVSAHQGLAVNAIPAAAAPAASDQIILAPQLATLAPEDTAIVEDGSFAQTSGADGSEALAGASDQALTLPATAGPATDLTALPEALPEDMPMTDAEAVERALEMALAEGGDGAAQTEAATAAPAAAVATLDPVSMSTADPVAPPTAEIDPATIALGTPMVQLGAYDDPSIAREEWANLQTRFTELMAGKALVVEQAKSGGRDFYRLRAHGFDSEDDTRRFCAAILAENGSCFPVDQR